jgi:hypothetical protein
MWDSFEVFMGLLIETLKILNEEGFCLLALFLDGPFFLNVSGQFIFFLSCFERALLYGLNFFTIVRHLLKPFFVLFG